MTPKILPCYRYKDRVIARELDKNNYQPLSLI
jgi:hypothetical protein